MVAFCSSTLPDRPMMGMKTPKPSAWHTLNTLWVKSRGRKLSQAEQAFIAELENTYEKQ